MRFMEKVKDGGPNSPVTAYVLIEIKPLFSIMLLHFPKGEMREKFHSHAFHAITLWLKGKVVEENFHNYSTPDLTFKAGQLKFTDKDTIHRVRAVEDTWALTFRGPWRNWWVEYDKAKMQATYLTHGRKEIV